MKMLMECILIIIDAEGRKQNEENVKNLGHYFWQEQWLSSTVGCMPTSKPQESTGEQNVQASDATQGTEEPAAPEGLEVDTQTPITRD